jgi:hypothetical protein
VWQDPQRRYKPEPIEDFIRKDPETRLIIVGDASMAPYELIHTNGAIYIDQVEVGTGLERLKYLANIFRHSVWFNPQPEHDWRHTFTVGMIRQVFPMFELTLDGLEKAVQHLMARH